MSEYIKTREKPYRGYIGISGFRFSSGRAAPNYKILLNTVFQLSILYKLVFQTQNYRNFRSTYFFVSSVVMEMFFLCWVGLACHFVNTCKHYRNIDMQVHMYIICMCALLYLFHTEKFFWAALCAGHSVNVFFVFILNKIIDAFNGLQTLYHKGVEKLEAWNQI